MSQTQILQCITVVVFALLVAVHVFDWVRKKTCRQCGRFGLEKDTRRYRAEDVEIVDTIVYCRRCGELDDHYAHFANGENVYEAEGD